MSERPPTPGSAQQPVSRQPPPHGLVAGLVRAFATTDEFTDLYRQHRPMVERTIT